MKPDNLHHSSFWRKKMKQLFICSICLIVVFCGTSLTIRAANDEPQVVTLPDARAGESYRVEIEAVLRDEYRLRLVGGGRDAILQWSLAAGELPAGLAIQTGGTLVGTLQESGARSYRFRLKVVDVSAPAEALTLDCVLNLKAPGLRLVKINGPVLVPIDGNESAASRIGSSPGSSAGDNRTTAAEPVGNDTVERASTPSSPRDGGEPLAKTVTPKKQNSELPYDMRAILGIEQSGASSAASAQNPFIDFFFSKRLSNNQSDNKSQGDNQSKKKSNSQWLAWGDVKLTSTPQQVAAFASSGTNVVGAAKGDKINDLASSFDFKVGPELQFNTGENTSVSLIAGFGAISTLTGPPKVAPIFKVPGTTSTQYANFISQYPEAKAPGAAYISFVPQEQDRFFRRYFLGLRVKSYHDGEFPSMFDVTFGQNSAVTEGKLRHFVLGFEGSHRFALMNNSIYIFGSTNLKIGGPKFRSTPFILEPAETTVKLSDPNVVITSRQSNRDFYRIGFGVDLIELFKPKEKKDK